MVKHKKKKKQHRLYMCYAEELKRWISVSEAVRRRFHPDEFDDETSGGEVETNPKLLKKMKWKLMQDQKVIDIIVEYLERRMIPGTNQVFITNVTAAEGYYEGLEEELGWEDLFVEDINLPLLNKAWWLFRQKYPIFPKTNGVHPKYIETEGDLNRAKGITSTKRTKIFEFTISGVIQQLAREGWGQSEIRKVMDHLNVDVKDTTIKGQMWCGMSGRYLRVATMSDKQIDELQEMIK